MKPHASICQPDQLKDFLNGQLSASEEEHVLDHLNDCERCRRRLDESAAAPDSWADAQSFLKDDELDRVFLSSIGDHHAIADE